jgi:hypothetical protein
MQRSPDRDMRTPPRWASEGGAAFETDRLAGAISTTDIPDTGVGQLIDKHGHLHSEAIFRNWSPAAIKALGIRRVEIGGVE